MMNTRIPRPMSAGVVLGMVAAMLAGIQVGCVPVSTTTNGEGNVGIDPNAYPNLRVAGEPNDSFAQALTVILDDLGRGRLQGRISSADDVDVYVLEGLSAGDRLLIDVTAEGSGLDADLAVFDEAGRLIIENDDRNASLGQLDPYVNQVLRRDSSAYFLAICKAPLGEEGAIGSYEVLITTVLGDEVPVTAGQVVALDFDGGTITVQGFDTYTVGSFDTADISHAYRGMTDEVQAQILATCEENYEGLALDWRVLPGDSVPSTGNYSSVLFGGENSYALGLSQAVDSYNSDLDDMAIVFTEMFTPVHFGRTLSAEELGIAIGNVASHEIGHLLGLAHVADVDDLMDTTGNISTLLEDQEFRLSPLDETIFPIGSQDGWLLLLETLGVWP